MLRCGHIYEFCDFSGDFDMSMRYEEEQILNLCETPIDKLKSVYYNFTRFINLARLYPEWFVLFGIFYLILQLLVLQLY